MTGAGKQNLLGRDRKATRRLAAWFDAHRWVDLIVVAVLVLVAFGFGSCTGIGALDGPGRRALYQTLAGLSATLFGLTMTTVSIVSSSMDKPIGGSRQGLSPALVEGITSRMFDLLGRLGLMLLASLALMIFDSAREQAFRLTQPVVLGAVVLVALGLLRALLLLSTYLLARVPSRQSSAGGPQ